MWVGMLSLIDASLSMCRCVLCFAAPCVPYIPKPGDEEGKIRSCGRTPLTWVFSPVADVCLLICTTTALTYHTIWRMKMRQIDSDSTHIANMNSKNDAYFSGA